MSLLSIQVRQLMDSARPHAQAALEQCRHLDDEAALSNAHGALNQIRALSEKKRYGLLDQASHLIAELRDELVELRKMKDLGYRERFKASEEEKNCIRMLEIRYRVNGMEALKDAAEALKTLRLRIDRTWSAPRKNMLPEHFRAAPAREVNEDDDSDEHDAISPMLLKLVARKNQRISAPDAKGARPLRAARR